MASSDVGNGGEALGLEWATLQSATVKARGSPSKIVAVVGPLVASAIKAGFLPLAGMAEGNGGGFRSGRILATCTGGFALGLMLGAGA